MWQPLVSVVTPVYNGEKYLAECIESILAQSYQNWEYVIVNNCSTDRSLEIAQHYAQQDDRLRIHNNDRFLNQMQNWNHALRQISPASKYCKVVHADDWLFPECLSQMVAVAEANPTVGIVGAYRLDENYVNLDGLPYPSTFLSGREICRATLLHNLYVFGSPTSLLLRSDLVRSRPAFYNESNIHADQEVCFELLQNADFGFVHQVLTYTRRHNESTTTFTQRFETFRLGHLTVLKKYGPVFLSREEFEERLNQKMDRYYRFLAQKVFELKDREFWDFHKHELENLGHPLSQVRLFKNSVALLLNFDETARRLMRAIRQKRQGPAINREVKRGEIISAQET